MALLTAHISEQLLAISVETWSGHPGQVIWVNRVTFCPGHPGSTWFTDYPGLTWIGSREKRNCFDDMETY